MSDAGERTRIRTALPSDADPVIDLIHALNLYEAGISGDRRLDRAAAAAYYADLCQRVAKQEGRILVAEAAGRIVAVLGLTMQEDDVFVSAEMRRHGYVTDLIVAQEWRRRGVAHRLLAEAERETRAKGLKRLYVGVLAGNQAAEGTYRRFGFRPYASTLMKPLE